MPPFLEDPDSSCEELYDIPFRAEDSPPRTRPTSSTMPVHDLEDLFMARPTNFVTRAPQQDRRQEKTYREYDEQRQTISPFGLTRDEMLRWGSASPPPTGSSLFFEDTSINQPNPSIEPTPEPATPAPEEACSCPISLDCPHRLQEDLLDCRPLVAEWKHRVERMDEEAYQVLKTSVPLPTGNTASSGKLRQIVRLLDQIDTIPLNQQNAREIACQGLRQWILDMRHLDVDQHTLDATQVLNRMKSFIDPSNAVNRRTLHVSDWIIEEVTILERKWRRGDLLCDPNRGLLRSNLQDVNHTTYQGSYRLDKNWQFFVQASYFGEGDLVNGQQWYSRDQLMRDGVHGAKVAGISGTVRNGAYSVVMGLHTKTNKYADVDRQDEIEYQGTARPGDVSQPTNVRDPDQDARPFNETNKPTNGTQALMKSLETGEPVRVIRSFKLAPIVANRPLKGYRYDGLYRVVEKIAQKEERQIWSFKMRRIPGQGELRGVTDANRITQNNAAPIPATGSTASRGRNGWRSTRRRRRI